MKPSASTHYRALGLSLLTLGTAVSSAIAGNITWDTTPEWNGTDEMGLFGVPNTATYGQTFIAPAGAVALQDFTFLIRASANSHLIATPFVMQWSGDLTGGTPTPGGAVGPTLHLGSTITLDPTPGFEEILVNVGSVPVTPGNAYVIGMTFATPADFNGSTGDSSWALLPNHTSSPHGGGGFVFFNNLSTTSSTDEIDPARLTTEPWESWFDFGDLAFKATFSTGVPDAGSSLAFLGLGLFGLTYATRRTRRA